MTLTGLALRNLGRNKFRVILTAAGVAIAIVAFLLLRTVIWSYASGASVYSGPAIVNLPITSGFAVISIIIAMTGTATTPLMTALQ